MEFTFEGVTYAIPLTAEQAYECAEFVLPDGRTLVASWLESYPPQLSTLLVSHPASPRSQVAAPRVLAVRAPVTVVDLAFQEVLAHDETGVAVYNGSTIRSVMKGVVPLQILWSTDRGNAMWDGVCAALRAAGIDPNAPL